MMQIEEYKVNIKVKFEIAKKNRTTYLLSL